MKIPKKRLKQIIREEHSKVVNAKKDKRLKEGLPAGGVPYKVQDQIDSFGYRMGEELSGMLYQLDSDWHNNANIYNAVRQMLESIKSEYMSGA